LFAMINFEHKATLLSVNVTREAQKALKAVHFVPNILDYSL